MMMVELIDSGGGGSTATAGVVFIYNSLSLFELQICRSNDTAFVIGLVLHP